jgi:hypothetical protein
MRKQDGGRGKASGVRCAWYFIGWAREPLPEAVRPMSTQRRPGVFCRSSSRSTRTLNSSPRAIVSKPSSRRASRSKSDIGMTHNAPGCVDRNATASLSLSSSRMLRRE